MNELAARQLGELKRKQRNRLARQIVFGAVFGLVLVAMFMLLRS